MEAGKLRHRVAIQQKVPTQDPDSGEIINTWATVPGWDKVPAAIEPVSAKEFVAGQQVQSQVTTRITIRARPGVLPTMRILHGAKIYNIEGILPDRDSGLDYFTLPVSEGVSDGG